MPTRLPTALLTDWPCWLNDVVTACGQIASGCGGCPIGDCCTIVGALRLSAATRVRELGLTRVQLRVLFTLERTKGGISQTELADLLEMEKAPLGKIIDRLEDGGWVVRRHHPTDRRAKLVSATAKIERFAEQIATAAQATFAQLLQGVRQNELKDLIARLEKLKRNLGGAEV